MYATDYFESLMLNVARQQNITAPATMYLALFQSNPSDTGTGGTEVSYTGYTRQAITFSAPAVSGSGLMIQNSTQITFPEAPASGNTATYVAVMDSLTGGNMWLYGQLDQALTIQAGVSPVFRQGNVKWIWSGNLSTYYRTAVMNTLRGTNLSGFTPYIGFANGDPTGSGNEFSGNNYARVSTTFSAPAQQSSGTAMIQNSNPITTGIATGTWGTWNTAVIYDSQTGGNAYAVIPLNSSYLITTGYTAGFAAGNLQFNVN